MLDTYPDTYLKFAVQDTAVNRKDGNPAFSEALKAAFDYRGDITLTLDTGETLVGYVFSLDEGTLGLYPKDAADKRFIPVSIVQSILFSGRDTAK